MSDYPQGWHIAQDFSPTDHLMQIERFDKRTQRKVTSDYLTVQNRLIWFIRDQRDLIARGLAAMPYIIQTDLVELDRQEGWAHFKTYLRDVLGNEATMYGSESVRDFPDFIEKASTKSLGRALLLLGYGTAFVAELDEGERVVDAPRPAAGRVASATAPADDSPASDALRARVQVAYPSMAPQRVAALTTARATGMLATAAQRAAAH